MIRPLSPMRSVAAGIDRDTTLTLNDGTVWRPLMPSGRMVLVGESKPIIHRASAQPPPPHAVRRAADPPRPVQRPLF